MYLTNGILIIGLIRLNKKTNVEGIAVKLQQTQQ